MKEWLCQSGLVSRTGQERREPDPGAVQCDSPPSLPRGMPGWGQRGFYAGGEGGGGGGTTTEHTLKIGHTDINLQQSWENKIYKQHQSINHYYNYLVSDGPLQHHYLTRSSNKAMATASKSGNSLMVHNYHQPNWKLYHNHLVPKGEASLCFFSFLL